MKKLLRSGQTTQVLHLAQMSFDTGQVSNNFTGINFVLEI